MDFTAVAHDLRAPLNVMLGYMQLLAVERLSDTGRKRLEILEAQIRRMIRLLDSCSEEAARVPYLAPVDLSATIRNVVSELNAVLERREIEIVLAIEGTLPFVLGDGDLLHRVLVNVLINAADSIASSGRIEIGARAEQVPNAPAATIQIDIADTGVGIPVDLIPRVFEHGFTTKAPGEGRGFGLGICREIVHMHGGGIQLSSEPGRGTTVHLSLPVKP
jgi:signal transduction histidine kinase